MTFLTSTRRLPRLLTGRYAPWSGETWRITAHVLTGGVLGVLTGSIVLTLIVLTVALMPTVILALGMAMALVSCVHGFAGLHRSRFDAFLGETILAPTPPPHPAAPGWFRDALRSDITWRQLAYHLITLVVGGAGATLLALAWSGGFLLILAPVLSLLPGSSTAAAAPSGASAATSAAFAAASAASAAASAAEVAGGIALLLAAPWLARGLAAADLVAARALLGPDVRAELTRRVAAVEQSRAGLVAAADAERRRIERDLHDGMQQRLVALAMNLGIARASSTGLPDELRDAIGRSHDDAKEALSELRHVVRGLYPAVLDDRGLDAALSGIVASSPVPAKLHADLPIRPPAAIEAVAYFVVAESLANVAKHAFASHAQVDVRLHPDKGELRIVIADNGIGGARPERGTGLRGLAQRVASVDGTLTVDSPPGGPTTILVVLPCA